MSTHRLSLNTATTKHWTLEEAADGCVRAGIEAIGLWRDRVAEAGLEARATWQDPKRWFAVVALRPSPRS